MRSKKITYGCLATSKLRAERKKEQNKLKDLTAKELSDSSLLLHQLNMLVPCVLTLKTLACCTS